MVVSRRNPTTELTTETSPARRMAEKQSRHSSRGREKVSTKAEAREKLVATKEASHELPSPDKRGAAELVVGRAETGRGPGQVMRPMHVMQPPHVTRWQKVTGCNPPPPGGCRCICAYVMPPPPHTREAGYAGGPHRRTRECASGHTSSERMRRRPGRPTTSDVRRIRQSASSMSTPTSFPQPFTGLEASLHLLEWVAPDVLHVSFNRPPVNALVESLWRETQRIFDHIRRNSDVRAVVLSGQKRCFTAGLDCVSRYSPPEPSFVPSPDLSCGC